MNTTLVKILDCEVVNRYPLLSLMQSVWTLPDKADYRFKFYNSSLLVFVNKPSFLT